jgi:hypothetical protein
MTNTHNALWSGYQITVVTSTNIIQLQTETGVRGINIPIVVTETSDGIFKAYSRGQEIPLVSYCIYPLDKQ